MCVELLSYECPSFTHSMSLTTCRIRVLDEFDSIVVGQSILRQQTKF